MGFDACLAFTLLPSDDGQPFHQTPGDPGGDTAWGITLATFTYWRKSHGRAAPNASDLKNITDTEREALYGALFWNVVHGDSLPAGVDLMVFDDAVVGGTGTAARQLQQAVGVFQDGSIGPQTLDAVGAATDLIAKIAQIEHDAYARGNRLFVNGWENRLARRTAAAQAMAGPPVAADSDDLNNGQLAHPGTLT